MAYKKNISNFFKIVIMYLLMVSANGQDHRYKTYLKVLGTVQDGGSPHIGCKKSCCKDLSLEEKKEESNLARVISNWNRQKPFI